MNARAIALAAALVAALASPAAAQSVPPGLGGAGAPDDYVVGGLGVAGMPSQKGEEPHFKVRTALAGGPCEGRLADGDAIVGVERRPLAKDEDILVAIEAAV